MKALILISLLFSFDAFAGRSLATKLPVKKEAYVGFKTLSRACKAYSKPYKNRKPVLIMKKQKKLWLEAFDNRWSMAYRKSGRPIFVPNSCFNS